MIMQPRRGYVVDHIDGNGLHSRRCHLRDARADRIKSIVGRAPGPHGSWVSPATGSNGGRKCTAEASISISACSPTKSEQPKRGIGGLTN